MRSMVLSLVAVALWTTPSPAQNRTVFITNVGYGKVSSYSNSYGHLGYTDIPCANGLCYLPTLYGPAALPQSIAFFALSNPGAVEVRLRPVYPGLEQLVTTDSFGNEVILNAGIRSTPVQRHTFQFRH